MFFPVYLQGLAVAVTALAIGLAQGLGAAGSALFGGAAAVANTVLLLWRHRQGGQAIHCDAGRHLRSFYRSSVERIVVVSTWLGLGLGGLGLDAKPMLIGFVIGLLAGVIAAAGRFVVMKR